MVTSAETRYSFTSERIFEETGKGVLASQR